VVIMHGLFTHDAAADEKRRLKRIAKRALKFSLSAIPRLSNETLSAWWGAVNPHKLQSITNEAAASFLIQSRMPVEVLARVWQAAMASSASHVNGRVNYAEFSALVRVAALAQQVNEDLLLSDSTVAAAVAGRLSLKPTMHPAEEKGKEVEEPKKVVNARIAAAIEASIWASPPSTGGASQPPPGASAPTLPPPLPPLPPPPPLPLPPPPPSPPPSLSPTQEEPAVLAPATSVPSPWFTMPPLPPPEEASPPLSWMEEPRSPQGHSLLLHILEAHRAERGPGSSRSGGTAASEERVDAPAESAPPLPMSRPAALRVTEEQRARWVGGLAAMGGVRGCVTLLSPVAEGAERSLLLLDTQGMLARAQLSLPSDTSGSGTATIAWMRRDGIAPEVAALHDSSVDAAELHARKAASKADPAFISVTNPDCLLVRCGGRNSPMTSPTPVLCWLGGAAAAGPALLLVQLQRRSLLVPFRQAAELQLSLRSAAASPLTDVRVSLCVGDAVGDGGVELQRASHHGTWNERDRTYLCAALPSLQPGDTATLQLRCMAKEGGGGGAAVLHALVHCRMEGALASFVVPIEREGGAVECHSVLRAHAFLDEADAERYDVAQSSLLLAGCF